MLLARYWGKTVCATSPLVVASRVPIVPHVQVLLEGAESKEDRDEEEECEKA